MSDEQPDVEPDEAPVFGDVAPDDMVDAEDMPATLRDIAVKRSLGMPSQLGGAQWRCDAGIAL